ncbi:hypothetical protein HPB48_014529 [Haemaphysalis longicornis]|uniref:CUB domain-containing protein n=1 Tax=Haemaphysalis longicornis TaxID=44386 RepID=A0A9J6GY11_HAELO|nr:hypothetical protein HPB48_014529 [Haemaphysalis longicornis]
MIDFINGLNTTWKAGRQFHKDVPLEYLTGLAGVHPDSHKQSHPVYFHKDIPKNLPEEFDARKNWPHCKSIGVIRDQGNCGSCWAVAAAEAMSDRICIHSKGKVQVNVSAEDIISCCKTCGYGAGGRGYQKRSSAKRGAITATAEYLPPPRSSLFHVALGHAQAAPGNAWLYYKEHGVVTGGLYDSDDGCMPYPFAPCEHSIKEASANPEMLTGCRKGYAKSYSEDKHFASKVYSISNNETQLMAEIFKNGPVEADMAVYVDFFSYKSGVYQTHLPTSVGYHSIRILGWGTENGTPYWLAANSWNTDWGDKENIGDLCGKTVRLAEGKLHSAVLFEVIHMQDGARDCKWSVVTTLRNQSVVISYVSKKLRTAVFPHICIDYLKACPGKGAMGRFCS